jgi:hypothetical protein
VVANSHKGRLLSFLQAVGLLTLGRLANEGSRIILKGYESTLLRLVLVFDYYTKVTQQYVFRANDGIKLQISKCSQEYFSKRVKVALCMYRRQTNNKELDLMSKPNVKETSQRPEGDDKTTLGGFKGCMGFELREAGHKLKVYALWLKSLGKSQLLQHVGLVEG